MNVTQNRFTVTMISEFENAVDVGSIGSLNRVSLELYYYF